MSGRERIYLFDTTLRDGAQTNGVDFTLHDKLAIAAMLDDLGIDYIEGGYPGANPTDTELFGTDRDLRATFTAFGMTRRPGRSASNDPGLAGAARCPRRRDLLRRQVVGLSRQGRARDDARGQSRLDPRERACRRREGPRGPARLRAFLRRLQGQSRLRARLRQGRLRGRRALGGAVRHQRRHAAPRDRGDRRRGGEGGAGRSRRHPRPQRHRAGGRQFARRSARPARARSRARSTGSASAAATPTSFP